MVNNWMSYHYSVNQVNLLRKEYEYTHDFKYDWVVKIRSDCEPREKIHYEKYDNSVHTNSDGKLELNGKPVTGGNHKKSDIYPVDCLNKLVMVECLELIL